MREDHVDFLEVSTNLNGFGWHELTGKGFERFTGVGTGMVNTGNAGDIKPDEPFVANSWYVQKKEPWPTLTRRLQFDIGHPFYQEMGAVLPTYKEDPSIGGDYPSTRFSWPGGIFTCDRWC